MNLFLTSRESNQLLNQTFNMLYVYIILFECMLFSITHVQISAVSSLSTPHIASSHVFVHLCGFKRLLTFYIYQVDDISCSLPPAGGAIM